MLVKKEDEHRVARFTILHSNLLRSGSPEVIVYDKKDPESKRTEGFYNVTPATLALPVLEALKLAEREGSEVIMEFIQVNWARETQEFE